MLIERGRGERSAVPSRAEPGCRIRPEPGRVRGCLRDVWRARDLMVVLTGRDLKLRYKQTALGVLWVVLQPLLSAGIFAFVFGKVARLPSGGRPYFLFSFVGLLGWRLFSATWNQAGLSLLDNVDLITKIYFPRLVLPLYTVLAALVDFAVSLAMLAVLFAVYRVRPGPAVLLLPVWVAVLLALSLGAGLVCSTLIVRYRDVKHMMAVATQTLFYASPVAYAVSAVPGPLRWYCYLNPLAAPLEAFRWSLLGTAPPPAAPLLLSVGLAAASFGAGLAWFQRVERTFADTI